MLRTRLYDHEREKRDAARSADRRDQIGSGDRSERIRTYNFPQGRVTDHRINLTLYKLPQVIEGEALGEIIDALVTENQAALLAAQIRRVMTMAETLISRNDRHAGRRRLLGRSAARRRHRIRRSRCAPVDLRGACGRSHRACERSRSSAVE